MKRSAVASALAVAVSACGSQQAPPSVKGRKPCSISMVVVDSGPGPLIGNPPRLKCVPGEQLDITLDNEDGESKKHKFEIVEIHCVADQSKTYNPVKDFVGNSSDDIDGGGRTGHFKKAPQMLSMAEIKMLQCTQDPKDPNAFVYKYTIRSNGAQDRDPELEVSPPPDITSAAKP
jgi:hypothetical protein